MSMASEAAEEINAQITERDIPEMILPPEVYKNQVDSSALYTTRWAEIVQEVYGMEDGSFLALTFRRGLTELQEEDPCACAREVVPELITTTIYETKE